jgi:predicted DNA-binding protein (MmcQ/YjbR family)
MNGELGSRLKEFTMAKIVTTSLHKYLIQLPEAILDYPFGADIHVYKVEGKVFAIYFKDDTSESINLKCDPVHAQELRAVFREVTPGYHMNKKHWNTLDLTGDLPKAEIHRQIDHSYDLIVKKLPKATKQRLRILHERLAWLK